MRRLNMQYCTVIQVINNQIIYGIFFDFITWNSIPLITSQLSCSCVHGEIVFPTTAIYHTPFFRVRMQQRPPHWWPLFKSPWLSWQSLFHHLQCFRLHKISAGEAVEVGSAGKVIGLEGDFVVPCGVVSVGDCFHNCSVGIV